MDIRIPVAAGELTDKIAILEIKAARIADAAKLANVRAELALLAAVRDREIPATAEMRALAAELKSINQELWDIEDAIRDCERAGDFGPRFIALARAVYRTNDRRAATKRRIDAALGSKIREEKSYATYE
jgi:hypothetical protein